MLIRPFGATSALALFLVACTPASQKEAERQPHASAPSVAVALPSPSPPPAIPPPAGNSAGPPPGYSDEAGVNEGYPDLAPAQLTPEAAKGVKGARNFLLSFARAIELKEFDQAWAMLSPGDKQKWSTAAFTKMFADLGKITVAIPDGTNEGAAGSVYYTSPVIITATDKQGRPVRIEGESVLRRVNDVEGATPAQLRWHFDHLTLDWTH